MFPLSSWEGQLFIATVCFGGFGRYKEDIRTMIEAP